MKRNLLSDSLINKRHFIFILNPISGTQDKTHLPTKIHQYFKNLSHEIILTKYPGHATEIAKKYAFDENITIVAIGGDGTVNEVVQAIVHQPCYFGIIPTGSGNGFAGHNLVNLGMAHCIQRIMGNRYSYCDVVKINEFVSCNTIGIGLSGYVAQIFNSKGNRGLFNYVKLGLGTFSNFEVFSINVNDINYEFNLSLEIANSSQLGNKAYISPNSSVQDGQVELVFLKKPKLYQVPRLIYDVFSRNLNRNSLIMIKSFDHGIITLMQPNHYHIDGEYKGESDSFKFEVIRDAIKLLS